ncbi:MAG: DUF3883 domain-containing protein [Cyclobacteriaceae bacterium]
MIEWSDLENELITASYFEMLSNELSAINYSKTAFRKKLKPLLNNRSDGAIEYKHQNISAVLINLGQPYINGYLPRYNYQARLEEAVITFLRSNVSINRLFQEFIEFETQISEVHFGNILVDAPQPNIAAEPTISYGRPPITVNYLEKEQNNRHLGTQGEQLVFEYEKWFLKSIGKNKLAKEVRWISKEEGDGAGFDILSKNGEGGDKFIEVKSTKLGKETPFYYTKNELDFSKEKSGDFHLYRVFNMSNNVKLFIRNGILDQICSYSVPMTFKGYV